MPWGGALVLSLKAGLKLLWPAPEDCEEPLVCDAARSVFFKGVVGPPTGDALSDADMGVIAAGGACATGWASAGGGSVGADAVDDGAVMPNFSMMATRAIW